MRIQLNGEPHDTEPGQTVDALVRALGQRPERVAVERNRLVVRRGDWATTVLAEGDVVEVLTFVGGG